MSKVQKNIRFDTTIIKLLEKEGSRIGMNFNEYVVHIIANKAEEILNLESEQLIADVVKARKEPRTNVIKNAADLDRYFNAIGKE